MNRDQSKYVEMDSTINGSRVLSNTLVRPSEESNVKSNENQMEFDLNRQTASDEQAGINQYNTDYGGLTKNGSKLRSQENQIQRNQTENKLAGLLNIASSDEYQLKSPASLSKSGLNLKANLEQNLLKRARNQVAYTQDNTLEKEKLKCEFKDLDKEFTHQEQNSDQFDFNFEPVRSAAQNKLYYRDNFAVNFTVPAVNILDTKIFTCDPNYQMQLLKYIFPDKPDLHVRTHDRDGSVTQSTYKKIFKQYDGKIVVRLLHSKDNLIENMGELILDNVHDSKITISPDGEDFCLMYSQEAEGDDHGHGHHHKTIEYKICVLKIENEDVMSMMEDLKNGRYHCEFSSSEMEKAEDRDWSFIQRMFFDCDDEYIVGYGDTHFILLHIIGFQDCKCQCFGIDPNKFNEIMDINISENENKQIKCTLACKVNLAKQILVFDFFKNKNFISASDASFVFSDEDEEPGLEDSSDIVEDQYITINFKSEPTPELRVKINNDNDQILFTNNGDTFLVNIQNGKQYHRFLSHLQNKKVRFIIEDDEGFICISCDEYDDKIQINHASNKDYSVQLEKTIVPGNLLIYDAHVLSSKTEIGDKSRIIISNLNQDEYIYEIVQWFSNKDEVIEESRNQEVKVLENSKMTIQSFKNTVMNAYSMNWPYVSFSGLENELTILNASAQDVIHRVPIVQPNEKVTICTTYITDTRDLFILAYKYTELKYYLYMLDLDGVNVMENDDISEIDAAYKIKNEVLCYHEDDVENEKFEQIHIRGDSRKEKVDFKQSLQVFILHGFKIYQWTKGRDSLQFVLTVSFKKMTPISDSFFLIGRTLSLEGNEDFVIAEEIKAVRINFTTYQIDHVLRDDSITEDIVQFNFDKQEDKLIMITVEDQSLQKQYRFKVFDFKKREMEFECLVTNKEIIGRLSLGMYQLNKGHIYFNNVCIKIRYDLTSSKNNFHYGEDQIFDIHQNLFDIEDNEYITSQSPFESIQAHKCAYIIQDKNYGKSPIIQILPHLHENKIYLNRIKGNTKYYYTVIDTPVKDQILHNQYISSLQQQNDSCQPDEEEIAENLKDAERKSFSSVMCLNMSENKIYIYTQNGLLIRRYEYEDIVDKYGNPCCVSQNGQNYVFVRDNAHQSRKKLQELIDIEKRKESIDIDRIQSLRDEQFELLMTLTILHFNAFGVIYIKEINIFDAFLTYYKNRPLIKNNKGKEVKDQPDFFEFKQRNIWLYKAQQANQIDSIDMKIQVNNNFDVCIRLKEKNVENGMGTLKRNTSYNYARNMERSLTNNSSESMDFDSNSGQSPMIIFKKGQTKQTILGSQQGLSVAYYFESGAHNLDMNKINSENKYRLNQSLTDKIDRLIWNKDSKILQQVYNQYEKQKEEFDYDINTKYFILWNKKKVQYYDINKPFLQGDQGFLQTINMTIGKHDKENIHKVLTGNDKNKIAIIISSPNGDYTLMSWNFVKDYENESITMSDPFEIIFDQKGNICLAEKSYINILKMHCRIPSYSIQNLDQIQDSVQEPFTYNRGVKFDGKNHNWLIFREYMSLGFSYMTFVIKNSIEEEVDLGENSQFDQTGYNYVFNKSTSFLDGNFVQYKHAELQYVLDNFEQIDPNMLDLINYIQLTSKSINSKKNIFASLRTMTTRFSMGHEDNSSEESNEKHVVMLRNSAIHMAVNEGNNVSIDMILQAMSKTDINTSSNYKDLFVQLIEQQRIQNYLDKLPFQTEQMSRIHVLRMADPITNGDIVFMKPSYTLYVRSDFFQENSMKPKKSYPVNVVAVRIGWILEGKDDKAHGLKFLQGVRNSENLEFYRIQTMQVIIEFLYLRLKKFLIFYQTPLYVLNLITFMFLAQLNENYREGLVFNYDTNMVEGFYKYGRDRSMLLVLIWVNLILTVIQAMISFQILKGMGTMFFKRFYSWLDLILLVVNISLFGQFVRIIQVQTQEDFQLYKNLTISVRFTIVIGVIIQYSKLLYFLSLVEQIAPMIDIIYRVVYDIGWFCIVLIFMSFAFSYSFYIIGQSQNDFDNIDGDDPLPYLTLGGSFYYISDLVISNTNTAPFAYGAASQRNFLFFVYFLGVFIFMIHLMNMLIAIMGDTYAQRNEFQDEVKYQDHLNFVLDNWFLITHAFPNIDKIKYIVAGFGAEQEEKSDEQMEKIDQDITDLRNVILINQSSILQKINSTEMTVQNLMRLQELDDKDIDQFRKIIKTIN